MSDTIKTDHIEELSLHNSLEEETEFKKAGIKDSAFEWDFDNEEEESEGEEEEEQQTEVTNAGTSQPKKKNSPITEGAKRESAKTATAMLDLLQKSIFTPIISIKYSKKFTAEEIDNIEKNNLLDRDIETLEPNDKMLANKFTRLMAKCQSKLDDIPMKLDEAKSLEETFYTYFDVKQKAMPIEWLLYVALANSIGKRAIDVFTD